MSAGGRRRGRAALSICVTCRWKGLDAMAGEAVRPGRRLFELAREEAGPERAGRIREIVCLTHCMNACNAVATARCKPPLLMTRMAPDRKTARALLAMLERYAASQDGTVAPLPAAIPQARPLVAAPRGRSRG